jgi:hypothetical protein
MQRSNQMRAGCCQHSTLFVLSFVVSQFSTSKSLFQLWRRLESPYPKFLCSRLGNLKKLKRKTRFVSCSFLKWRRYCRQWKSQGVRGGRGGMETVHGRCIAALIPLHVFDYIFDGVSESVLVTATLGICPGDSFSTMEPLGDYPGPGLTH